MPLHLPHVSKTVALAAIGAAGVIFVVAVVLFLKFRGKFRKPLKVELGAINPQAEALELKRSKVKNLDRLIDAVYEKIKSDDVRADHYGFDWVFRVKETGTIIASKGMLANAQPGEKVPDKRRLKKAGIKSGVVLEVVRPEEWAAPISRRAKVAGSSAAQGGTGGSELELLPEISTPFLETRLDEEAGGWVIRTKPLDDDLFSMIHILWNNRDRFKNIDARITRERILVPVSKLPAGMEGFLLEIFQKAAQEVERQNRRGQKRLGAPSN